MWLSPDAHMSILEKGRTLRCSPEHLGNPAETLGISLRWSFQFLKKSVAGQDRSTLPLRSVLGVCCWQTAPEASRPFAARQGGYRKQERDSQAAGQGRGLGHSRHKKRTARLGGPSSMQGRLIGRYKRPAASLPGRRGFPGRRGWSGSQRSGGRRTCTPAHRQCPRPKSAPPPYRRPFGPFPAG